MTREEFDYDCYHDETFRERIEEQESIRAWREELEAEERYYQKKKFINNQ